MNQFPNEDWRGEHLIRAKVTNKKGRSKKRVRRVPPEVLERRQKVRQLAADRLPVPEIAMTLRLDVWTVRRDLQAMGIRAALAKRKGGMF